MLALEGVAQGPCLQRDASRQDRVRKQAITLRELWWDAVGENGLLTPVASAKARKGNNSPSSSVLSTNLPFEAANLPSLVNCHYSCYLLLKHTAPALWWPGLLNAEA